MIPDVPAPWPRPRYKPAGPARFAYVALLPEGLELKKGDHPLFAGLTLETKWKSEEPAWFEGFTDSKGTYGALLLRTPDLDVQALGSVQAAMVISGIVEEPQDLGHLQRCFVVLKLLCKAELVVALDVESMVWWTRPQLEALAFDFEFDVSDHMRVVFESAEREPGAGHLCHTLGMSKFGRPDLAIGGMALEHAEAAGEMLESLATALAEGDSFETGDVVEPDNFPPLECTETPDDTGADEATFGNRSIWLVPNEA